MVALLWRNYLEIINAFYEEKKKKSLRTEWLLLSSVCSSRSERRGSLSQETENKNIAPEQKKKRGKE